MAHGGGTRPFQAENVEGNTYGVDDVTGDKAAMRANTYCDQINLAAGFAED